jgi:hypothetical protein
VRTTCILLILGLFCMAPGPATRQSAGVEGTWESKGIMDIVGGSTDRILRIAPTTQPNIKSLTIAIVSNPRFDARLKESKTTTFGPFEAKIADGVLIVRYPAGVARYSYVIDGNLLHLPAFARNTDTEISIETSEHDGIGLQRDHAHPGVITIYKWQWNFSVAPESAARGFGHFAVKATPDPSNFSTQFDFKWEWRDDPIGRRLIIRRTDEGGGLEENGWFLWDKSGIYYYPSGGDRLGPSGVARRYTRVASPVTRPTTAPHP